MSFHMIGNFICGISRAGAVFTHVDRLFWSIVRGFALIEHHISVFPVPQGLIFLEMFVEKSVDIDVITVDNQSVFSGVDVPSYTSFHPMVRTPDPKVVADDIIAVYEHSLVDVYVARTESPDTEKQIGKHNGVLVVT